MEDKYVKGSIIKQLYGVSTSSLQSWANKGKIATIRTPGNCRLYAIEDVRKMFDVKTEERINKVKICYARVSSKHQEDDLGRQVELLRENYPEHEIIRDIGSGLNFKRPGFITLLDKIYSGIVEEVVVLYKDRLCRFGNELVEFICKKAGTRIVVHSQKNETERDNYQELSEDLLSIVTVFVAKNNGLRSGKNRRLCANEMQENSNVSKQEPETAI